MTNFSTIYKLSLVAITCFLQVWGRACPVLECWYVGDKVARGGLAGSTNLEKSLLHIQTDDQTHSLDSHYAESDVDPDRIFFITDPSASLCHNSLSPARGSVEKAECEVNPFLPQPSSVSWAAPLTDSTLSPIYLQADWFIASLQGVHKQIGIVSISRAPTGTKEHNVVLSVTSKTVSVKSRLGVPVMLDCSFWSEPSSPLSGAGFAVEWRYQFRGNGRLMLAYDSKNDRMAGVKEDEAWMDFESLHEKGNASLMLRETKVHHSGMYICSVYLPFLMAQLAVDLQIIEPPSLSIHPPSLPVAVPGQVITLECDAIGFFPLTLDLSWEFRGADGKTVSLGSGSVTGHRQSWDDTFSQSSVLELHTAALDLGRGGEVSCVAVHPGGTRRSTVAISIIGFSSPSIEDSMAMVGVALVLYGLIKFVSWTFTRSGSDGADSREKKEN